MNFSKKIVLFIFALPLFGSAQDPVVSLNEKLNARFVIKVNAGIPKPVTSTLFRKTFNGFYDAGISTNVRLLGNFYFGVGYENLFFKANAILRQQVSTNTNVTLPYDTRVLADAPFVCFSYDKYFKPTSYVTYALNYGYMLARYTNVIEDTTGANLPAVAKGFNAQFIKPEVSLNFIDKDNPWISFRVLLAYTTIIYKYDAKAPRLNQFNFKDTNGRAYSNRYYVSWLTFGFGLNILLGKSKE